MTHTQPTERDLLVEARAALSIAKTAIKAECDPKGPALLAVAAINTVHTAITAHLSAPQEPASGRVTETLDTSPATTIIPETFGHEPTSLAEHWARAHTCDTVRVGSRVWLKGDDPTNGHAAYHVIGRWQNDLWLHNFVFGRRCTVDVTAVVAYARPAPVAGP